MKPEGFGRQWGSCAVRKRGLLGIWKHTAVPSLRTTQSQSFYTAN